MKKYLLTVLLVAAVTSLNCKMSSIIIRSFILIMFLFQSFYSFGNIEGLYIKKGPFATSELELYQDSIFHFKRTIHGVVSKDVYGSWTIIKKGVITLKSRETTITNPNYFIDTIYIIDENRLSDYLIKKGQVYIDEQLYCKNLTYRRNILILEVIGKDGVKDGLTVSAQQPKWNKIVLDTNSKYKITNEGKIYNPVDVPGEEGPKKPSLRVNNDTLRTILFTEAKLNGDTLKILIYRTDPAYHHEYLITIVKGKYFIKYTFLTSGVQEKRTLNPLETKLKLNNLVFKKGKEIRGYTEYKGECTEGCWEKLIQVKGNFSVVIQ